MSQYQDNLRIGHLDIIYHIFSYLKSHTKMGCIGYDPMGLNVDLSVFNNNANWTEFYGDIEEELPPNIPEPHGMDVIIYLFLDAKHAGNVVIRRSRNGTIMFIQNTPII